MTRLRGELWPWALDEIAARLRGGDRLPAAVVDVAMHGPAPLRSAAESAQRIWRATGDTAAALHELQRAAGDPCVDRLCALLVATVTFDGDVDAALARLCARAAEDAQRDRQLDRLRSLSRLAAWSALLPVVGIAAGRPMAGAAAVVAAAASAWLIATLVLRTPAVRVWVGQP